MKLHTHTKLDETICCYHLELKSKALNFAAWNSGHFVAISCVVELYIIMIRLKVKPCSHLLIVRQ